MKPVAVAAALAAALLPTVLAVSSLAAPTRPQFCRALSDNRKIVKVVKHDTSDVYTVYRKQGESRFILRNTEYPYTISGVFVTYETIDCLTGWTQSEDKDYEKWLRPTYRHIPTVHRSSPGVVEMFRGYCREMGIRPKF